MAHRQAGVLQLVFIKGARSFLFLFPDVTLNDTPSAGPMAAVRIGGIALWACLLANCCGPGAFFEMGRDNCPVIEVEISRLLGLLPLH
ncbi:hypothetical protein CHARACLAT_032686 [Characodon lateralis]|uniref:Secreted protein n=1 Tax=Characodon lateralis TaxID=208331 RepID=A0ABU7EYY9_9TELE|nr:hypothetical protein [Characodon lateralis]